MISLSFYEDSCLVILFTTLLCVLIRKLSFCALCLLETETLYYVQLLGTFLNFESHACHMPTKYQVAKARIGGYCAL